MNREFTNVNKLVPEIRFQGFADDWEQRKVEEYAIFLTGNGLSWDDISDDGEQECILYGNLYTDYGMIADKVVYKTNTKVNKPVYSESGDVLIPASDTTPTGLARATSLEKAGVLLGGDINIIRPNADVNGSCLSLALNANRKELLRLIKGTTVRHIHNSDIKEIELFMPKSKDEQTKISEYFKCLDNLITLHQRKYNKLVSTKKSMLVKMFPRDGESVPEIRFDGFTDAWEQRKLSDCAGFRRGSFPQPYGNKEWYDGEGAMPFVQVADVSDDMKLVDDTKQKISTVAQPMSVFANEGSVLVTLQGSIGRVAITQYGAFVDRTVLIFDRYNQDIDKTFWAYIIMEKFIDEARKAPGGTIKTITKEALSDFDLMLPSYDEQRKLGTFLVSIDNLITLHQRKLDSLKNIKNAMLGKVFV